MPTILKILIITALAGVIIAVFWQQILDIFVPSQQWVYKNYYKITKKTPASFESRIDVVYFNSPSLKEAPKEFRVYVPKAYDENPNEKFPVLYLLHGDPGNDLDWIINTDIQAKLDKMISEKQIKPMLVVFPDGNGPKIKASMYVNATTVDQKMEDYIIKDTISEAEKRYRTKNDRSSRGIGGISSGAYAAMNLGLRHNDLFSIILSFGGYFDNWKGILNKTLDKNQQALNENMPVQYINNLKLDPNTHIFLSVGKIDLPSLKDENKKFDSLLTQKNISHEFVIGKGSHTWSEWGRTIEPALVYTDKNLK